MIGLGLGRLGFRSLLDKAGGISQTGKRTMLVPAPWLFSFGNMSFQGRVSTPPLFST
jgi:hypothetical protein